MCHLGFGPWPLLARDCASCRVSLLPGRPSAASSETPQRLEHTARVSPTCLPAPTCCEASGESVELVMSLVSECVLAQVRSARCCVCLSGSVRLAFKFAQVRSSSLKFVQLVQLLFIMQFMARCRVSVSGNPSSSDNLSGSSAAMSPEG